MTRVAIGPTAVSRQPRAVQGGLAEVVERTQRASWDLLAFASTEKTGGKGDVPMWNDIAVGVTAPVNHDPVVSGVECALLNE